MFRVHSYKRSYLDMWNARMSKPNVNPLIDKVVVAVLKRQGFDDINYVPRNLYDPAALYEALQHYSPEHSHFVDFKNDDVKAGAGMAFKAFAKPSSMAKLQAVRLDGPLSDVYDLLGIKGDKSAGLTAYGMTKLEAFSIAMRKVAELLRGERNADPCLAGTRTQAGKLGRLVWGYPLMMTIIEGCIARPLLNVFKGSNLTPMAFGKTSVQMGLEMRKAVAHNKYYVSMDASKFDTTVQAGVIKLGFNALKTWFNLDQEVGFGCTVKDIFDIVEDYFIHTPIVMPSEQGPKLYRGKRHGVPSGSYFTQIIDSIANVMMVGALDRHFKLKLNLSEVSVLGDDMLFFTNKVPCLEKYATLLRDLFHMNMNVKKSVCGLTSEPFHFLGREWCNGVPFRSFTEAVERAVSPERYRNYGEDKWRGASAVIASYGFTAMITGIPQRFDPYEGLVSLRLTENSASGFTDYLLGEGIISNRVSTKLY